MESQTTVNEFVLHTPSSASGKAAELLDGIWSRHDGQVGPMVRAMAGSPSVLSGYLDLSRAMKRSKLSRPVGERISLALQQRLGCELCLHAHTEAARAVGVSDDEIDAARRGTSADAVVAAIIRFAVLLDSRPAEVDAVAIDELRAFGYSDREILDVVGLVALNVLTGTFNLVAGLEPETPAPTIPQESTMSTTTTTFTVTGMTCAHCVAAVTEEVAKLDNVNSVDIDLASGAVTVQSDGPVDPTAFAAAVDEAGYEVAG